MTEKRPGIIQVFKLMILRKYNSYINAALRESSSGSKTILPKVQERQGPSICKFFARKLDVFTMQVSRKFSVNWF